MKTILTSLIILVAGLAWSGSVGSMSVYAGWKGIGAPTNAGAVLPHQYIVTIKDSADPDTVANRHGLALGHAYKDAMKGFSGSLSRSQLNKLWLDSDVLDIESDILGSLDAQTIPTGVARIGATNSAVAKINGIDERVNVNVAVIDTGIDTTHPDLNVKSSTSVVKKSNAKSGGRDIFGHGTHVAGIIGALDNSIGVVGVAPGANLYGVKVVWDSFALPLSDCIAGVDYVTKNSATFEVANMSISISGNSTALRTSISNCAAKGVVIVVAAGNAGWNVYGTDGVYGTADDIMPANFPWVITVSAMNDYDGIAGGLGGTGSRGPDDTLANYSNFGPRIDLAAPGTDIYSTYPVSMGSYHTMSGTSMAAPTVVGAVALYIATHGRATNYAGVVAIRNALIAAGQAQTSWGPVNTLDPDAYPEPMVIAP